MRKRYTNKFNFFEFDNLHYQLSDMDSDKIIIRYRNFVHDHIYSNLYLFTLRVIYNEKKV